MKILFDGVDSAICPTSYSLVESIDGDTYSGTDISLDVDADGTFSVVY